MDGTGCGAEHDSVTLKFVDGQKQTPRNFRLSAST